MDSMQAYFAPGEASLLSLSMTDERTFRQPSRKAGSMLSMRTSCIRQQRGSAGDRVACGVGLEEGAQHHGRNGDTGEEMDTFAHTHKGRVYHPWEVAYTAEGKLITSHSQNKN